LLNII